MKYFKLDLSKKTVLQKLAMGTTHITAMTGNANYPEPTRVPTDTQMETAQSDLQAADDAVSAAESAWKAAIAARNAKELAWDTVITARANNCEAVTPNDLVKLTTAGLPMRSVPAPVGNMPQPSNLRATMGDVEGEVDLQWDAIYGASSYTIEMKEHDTANPWTLVRSQQQSKGSVTGLTPGKVYAFRVRALGPNGEGPWSDEAVKMSP